MRNSIPAAAHCRVAWAPGWSGLMAADSSVYAKLDFSLAEKQWSRRKGKLELRVSDDSLPLPDFPLLHPSVLVFPDRLIDYGGWHEEIYELIPCSIPGRGKWWLLNCCFCSPALIEEASTYLDQSAPGHFRIAEYVMRPGGAMEPFFKLWQTSALELILDTGAHPPFLEWYEEQGCTGLQFEPLWAPPSP